VKSDDTDFMAEAKAEIERTREALSAVIRGDGPPLCPRCAELEAEVRRLRGIVDGDVEYSDLYGRAASAEVQVSVLREERNAARALLGELAAAVRALDAASHSTPGTIRAWEHLREVLRRAEAEAGGSAG
jgi:hypothetical protein